MRKRFSGIILSFTLLLCLPTIAQPLKNQVSEELEITRLTPSVYLHTSNACNGIILVNNGQAIIVSTPPSDSATQQLLHWVKDSLKARIVAYVIDRWHPDAMGGLGTVNLNDIKSYAYSKTRQMAMVKGLPIPEISFDPKITLKAGNKTLICYFLGEAHTHDGIVAWIPSDKVLFGGNAVRSMNGWVGNIADANLTEWPKTIRRIKSIFRNAEIVVPGHGPYGGQELIDYTLELYDFTKDQKNPYNLSTDSMKVRDLAHQFDLRAMTREDLHDNRVAYTNGKISFPRNEMQVEIYTPYFTYDMHDRQMMVPEGFMRISRTNQTESFNFKELKLNLRNDAVGMTMVIKSIENL